MNTTTQLATHSADNRDVHPSTLTAALSDLREEVALGSPGSLRLFDLFEPWALQEAGKADEPASPTWLMIQWRLFYVSRLYELFDEMERYYRPGGGMKAGMSGKQAFALHRELGSALLAHLKSKHRTTLERVANFARTWGAATIAAVIFLLSVVVGVDLTDRGVALVQALFRG